LQRWPGTKFYFCSLSYPRNVWKPEGKTHNVTITLFQAQLAL